VVIEQMLGTAVGLVNTYIVGHLGAAAFLLVEPLLRLFTTEPAVIAQGPQAVRGTALIEPPLAWYFVFSGALRGAGDTRFVLLAQGASIWPVRLPLAFRLGLTFNMGLGGV